MRTTTFILCSILGSAWIIADGSLQARAGGWPPDLSAGQIVHKTANEPSQDFKQTIRQALTHARKAQEAGQEGNSGELVQHSRKALDLAKEAQRSGHNERLNEGVYALGEAIEHGQKQETKDATEHVLHAIMKLSQSADLQVPEGAVPPSS